MHKSLPYYLLAAAAVLILIIFSASSQNMAHTAAKFSDATMAVDRTDKHLPQIVKAIDLDKSYNLAGEVIPKDNFDAMERLDRELLVNSYWHSNTVQNIKLANRYLPVIEKVLAENGVPDDFKYLAVAESSLRNATSPAGAKGLWQFLKGTAKEYGMEVNSEVDERYHVEKATKAACKYLKKQKERFGSWTLAAASYNMGASRLSKEIAKQRADTYYELNLNLETARYVFRIVAIKEILSNLESYGFQIETGQLYKPLDDYINIPVEGAVANWGDFAKKHGTNYRMLKIYNPWLSSSSLTNKSGKKYLIRVPKK